MGDKPAIKFKWRHRLSGVINILSPVSASVRSGRQACRSSLCCCTTRPGRSRVAARAVSVTASRLKDKRKMYEVKVWLIRSPTILLQTTWLVSCYRHEPPESSAATHATITASTESESRSAWRKCAHRCRQDVGEKSRFVAQMFRVCYVLPDLHRIPCRQEPGVGGTWTCSTSFIRVL